MSEDIARIAASITGELCGALRCIAERPLIGLAPGSNVVPMTHVTTTAGKHLFDTCELDALHRLGLAEALPTEKGKMIEYSAVWPELGEMPADYEWRATPLGVEVLMLALSPFDRADFLSQRVPA